MKTKISCLLALLLISFSALADVIPYPSHLKLAEQAYLFNGKLTTYYVFSAIAAIFLLAGSILLFCEKKSPEERFNTLDTFVSVFWGGLFGLYGIVFKHDTFWFVCMSVVFFVPLWLINVKSVYKEYKLYFLIDFLLKFSIIMLLGLLGIAAFIIVELSIVPDIVDRVDLIILICMIILPVLLHVFFYFHSKKRIRWARILLPVCTAFFVILNMFFICPVYQEKVKEINRRLEVEREDYRRQLEEYRREIENRRRYRKDPHTHLHDAEDWEMRD